VLLAASRSLRVSSSDNSIIYLDYKALNFMVLADWGTGDNDNQEENRDKDHQDENRDEDHGKDRDAYRKLPEGSGGTEGGGNQANIARQMINQSKEVAYDFVMALGASLIIFRPKHTTF
jgi:hypothetical protein